MTENLDHKIDRTCWPSGPWDGEPDRVQWTTRAGYAGLIIRAHHGAFCGYVGVPSDHPTYGRDYTSEYERDENGENDYSRRISNPLDAVDVHGGITYGDYCQGVICHVPEPGMPDNVFWHGFDCAHSGDLTPGSMRFDGIKVFMEHCTYRTLDYVRAQVESLAEQLKAMGVQS